MNWWKGENDRRKYFMIKSSGKNVANLAGIEVATSRSPVGRASRSKRLAIYYIYSETVFGFSWCVVPNL